MNPENGRRRFLKSMAGAVVAPYLLNATEKSSDAGTNGGAKVHLEPFDYRGVRLLESRWQKQYQQTRDFYFKLPDDNALIGFRQRAGLPAPGVSLGGWYGNDGFNVFPQWLSGMARMAAATGDKAIGDKAHNLMLEWGKTIEPDGYFYYSRKPTTFHYTYEKSVCGLVDLCLYGGYQDALPLLEKITDWAIKNLDRTRKPATADDPSSAMSEWYTLSENLYRAYQLTGNPKYKEFGDVWRYTAYWSRFTWQTTPDIQGLHAYSHVNTLSSAAMTYAVTGDPEYLKTIVNAYDYFDRTQFFVTGGFGPSERIMLADGSLGKSLEDDSNSFETICGSWAGFKLVRYLMTFTGEARYGDWSERLFYNGIGAALPMLPDGRTFYYSDYRLGGGRKIYGSQHLLVVDWRWPCCSGTFPQVVADFHNILYFKGTDGLYVNLFVPSEVTWTQGETEVKVTQETSYPEADSTQLTVQVPEPTAFAIKFRVPGWSNGATVKVNDTKLNVATKPGAWAAIERTWNAGDCVTIQIPMRLELVAVDKQHPRRVAFRYGPIVLVRTQESLAPASHELSKWTAATGQSLEFTLMAQSAGRLVPFYRLGFGDVYAMYFDLTG
jgi:DUF1680 family protein